MDTAEFFDYESGDTADDYARLLGHRVVIYYTDNRGTDRKLVGKIVEIDGDRLWLENHHSETGELWRGALNVRRNHISLISTVGGWGGKTETMTKEHDDNF